MDGSGTASFRLLLRADDCADQDIEGVRLVELDWGRSAMQQEAGRFPDREEGRLTAVLDRDAEFSCEWWPPD